MASTYSTNLALELIGTGDQAGTWGTTTNTNLGTLIEQAVSGYATQAITDGADTVITIPNGVTGVARNMYLELTGTLTAARNLIVPSNKKLYYIYNNTSGGYAVTVKVSGQTGVSVPNGKKMSLVSNGTDIVEAITYSSTTSVGGTSGQVQYNNSGSFGGSNLSYNNSTGGFSISAPTSGATLTAYAVSGSIGAFAAITSTSGSGSEYLQAWSNNVDSNLFVRLNQIGAATKFASIETTTATPLWLFTNNTQRVIVAAAGKVTINAPTSGTALQVNGNAGTDIVTITDGTVSLNSYCGGSQTYFGNRENANLNFMTNGTVKQVISGAGNVTINAPTSGTALTVNGVVWSNGSTGDNFACSDGSTTTTLQQNGNYLYFNNNADSATVGGFVWRTTSSYTERMRINTTGNVTINAPSSGVTLTTTAIASGTPISSSDGTVTAQLSFAGGTARYGSTSAHATELMSNGTVRVSVASAGNVTFSASAATTPTAVTFSATAMTVDCRLSNVFTTTFTANVTTAPTISNPTDGQTINWFITQDGTGSRTMTWPTSFKWPGALAGTLSTSANSVDLLVATYRAATGFWYATLSKGFA